MFRGGRPADLCRVCERGAGQGIVRGFLFGFLLLIDADSSPWLSREGRESCTPPEP
jgi:hypothetical protein